MEKIVLMCLCIRIVRDILKMFSFQFIKITHMNKNENNDKTKANALVLFLYRLLFSFVRHIPCNLFTFWCHTKLLYSKTSHWILKRHKVDAMNKTQREKKKNLKLNENKSRERKKKREKNWITMFSRGG